MTRHSKDTILLLDDHHSRLEGLLPTLETDAESLEKALSHFEFGQLSGPLRSVQGSLDEALKLLKRLVTLKELRGEFEALQALSHDLAPLLPAAEAGPWKDVLRGVRERSAKIQTANTRLSHKKWCGVTNAAIGRGGHGLQDQGERKRTHPGRRCRYALALGAARHARLDRDQIRLRHLDVRCMHGPCQWFRHPLLCSPISSVGAASVTTIEGLSPDRSHKVQRAWIAEDVPQCGYCQSGMIMAVAALLAQTPKPTDSDINSAISNICRCGTYQRIRRAIHRAAAA
jgi:[2Fe-2S] binding domain